MAEPTGFMSDQFDSPGVDVALARAMVGQAHASLAKAIERAVFIDREEVGRLHDVGRAALDGDSNDAEHDALYELTEALRDVLGLDE